MCVCVCVCVFRFARGARLGAASKCTQSGSCVARFATGYFSAGLPWHVDLITDDKNVTLSNDTHWQPVIHIRCRQAVASWGLGGCVRSCLSVVKECFSWVKPCSVSGARLGSGCLGCLARMNTALFSFHLVLLAGRN